MQSWMEGFQASIDFIERNLDQGLEIGEIAGKAALSPFYYQRIFGALCGMTVGEYIRARRMTLAAQALARGDGKVIDIAVRYGYESPDSFARAFQRFHGLTPSQAREPGAPLRSFAPLHIKIALEGGSMLEYQIKEKAPFTVVGIRRRISAEKSYQEIPRFWNEWTSDKKGLKGWIADLYAPWNDIPAGCETARIPGSLWAQFVCRGPLPDSLQKVNTAIWSEWLPALREYTLAGNHSLEIYMPPAEKPEDTLSYICVPLKKADP